MRTVFPCDGITTLSFQKVESTLGIASPGNSPEGTCTTKGSFTAGSTTISTSRLSYHVSIFAAFYRKYMKFNWKEGSKYRFQDNLRAEQMATAASKTRKANWIWLDFIFGKLQNLAILFWSQIFPRFIEIFYTAKNENLNLFKLENWLFNCKSKELAKI